MQHLQDQEQFEVLPQLTPQEQAKLYSQHLAKLNQFYNFNKVYEISHWYDTMKEFTFRSKKFIMTVGESYLIYSKYYGEEWKHGKKWEQSLKNKVQKILAEFGGGAFIKMATRSPKDKGWDYQNESQIQQVSNQLVKFLQFNAPKPYKLNPEFLNYLYKFFLDFSKPKLHLKSYSDFLNAFSRSQRIVIDLSDFSQLKGGAFRKIRQRKESEGEGEGEDKIEDEEMIEVWAREWKDCSWQQQFRCFFYNYQLTGICQYDQRCFFPEIQGKQSLIESISLNFFNKVSPKLKQLSLPNGVMDILLNFDPPSCTMVEINPFSRHTRASLFNWNEDQQLLKCGPIQTRIVKSVGKVGKAQVQRMMGMVEKGVGAVVQKACKNLGILQQWKSYQQ